MMKDWPGQVQGGNFGFSGFGSGYNPNVTDFLIPDRIKFSWGRFETFELKICFGSGRKSQHFPTKQVLN